MLMTKEYRVGDRRLVDKVRTMVKVPDRYIRSDPRQVKSRKPLIQVSMPPLADILHRTLVVGLLGVTVVGVGAGWAIHKDTLRRGQGS